VSDNPQPHRAIAICARCSFSNYVPILIDCLPHSQLRIRSRIGQRAKPWHGWRNHFAEFNVLRSFCRAFRHSVGAAHDVARTARSAVVPLETSTVAVTSMPTVIGPRRPRRVVLWIVVSQPMCEPGHIVPLPIVAPQRPITVACGRSALTRAAVCHVGQQRPFGTPPGARLALPGLIFAGDGGTIVVPRELR
jgi:hypothetical protein